MVAKEGRVRQQNGVSYSLAIDIRETAPTRLQPAHEAKIGECRRHQVPFLIIRVRVPRMS
jgi:hypothetical protein